MRELLNKIDRLAFLEGLRPGPMEQPREDLKEQRAQARLAWNGWPDTEGSRRIIAEQEARDPYSDHLETGRRTIRPAQRRLIEAYLAGYRPQDWPHRDEIV